MAGENWECLVTTSYICVVGFGLCWGAAVLIGPEPRPFDKGLIFVKEADILLSADR